MLTPDPGESLDGDGRAALRRRLGTIGAWSFALDELPVDEERRAARRIEAAGYTALWIPEATSSKEAFAHAAELLHATERIAIATGIANMWARDAVAMANGGRTLADAHAGRFILGVGAGHEHSATRRGFTWERPLSRMRWYVQRMSDAPYGGPDVAPPLLLAALGPRMLALARERAAGVHTYFVPVEHTARARAALGSEPVIAVEQTCVLEPDAVRARRRAREFASEYLQLPNYANNLRRLGFSEGQVAPPGDDRLIDETIAWGNADAVVRRVRDHLAAGADHVCIQVLGETSADVALDELERLAELLI
jgi:probable F420-dependent oxidoreductase